MYSSYQGHFCRIPCQLSLQKKLTLLKKTCPSDDIYDTVIIFVNAICIVHDKESNYFFEGFFRSEYQPSEYLDVIQFCSIKHGVFFCVFIIYILFKKILFLVINIKNY